MSGGPQLFPVTGAVTATAQAAVDAPFRSFNAAGLAGLQQQTPLSGMRGAHCDLDVHLNRAKMSRSST